MILVTLRLNGNGINHIETVKGTSHIQAINKVWSKLTPMQQSQMLWIKAEDVRKV